ncbi:acyl-CoA thioesterase [candidate division KSB1 bacterium]|nr:acyl-CoA thioesterase [candidate division KSB1 bacterium]
MSDNFKFQTSFTVRIGDINYGGHQGNDKFLLLFQDARIRFLATIGFSEANIGDQIGLIMNEAHIRYLAEVFLGDELIVSVRITDLTDIRFKFEYEVERTSDHKIVATGHTVMVAFNYEKRKIAKIPDVFKVAINEL